MPGLTTTDVGATDCCTAPKWRCMTATRLYRLLPDQPEILDSRALVYWLLDDKDKARRDLERAHQLDPSGPTWEERFREFEEMF